MHTTGELARVPLVIRVQRFGQAHGRYLFEAARGLDERPVRPHRVRKSLGREVTFQRDLGNRQLVEAALRRLAEAVTSALRERGVRARTVVLKLRYADFETLTRQMIRIPATAESKVLASIALALAARRLLAKKARLLGLRVAGLERAPAGEPAKRERWLPG